jgi:hypothetical protein
MEENEHYMLVVDSEALLYRLIGNLFVSPKASFYVILPNSTPSSLGQVSEEGSENWLPV